MALTPSPKRASDNANAIQRRGDPRGVDRRTGSSVWRVVGAAFIGLVVLVGITWSLTRSSTRGSAAPDIGGGLHSLVLDPSRPARLYVGGHTGADVSDDGGKTFRSISAFNGVDAMAWAIAPNGRTQLVAGHQGAKISADGGASWQSVNGLPGNDIHSAGMDPQDPSHLFVGIATVGLASSTNGGRSWQLIASVGADFMGPILVAPGGRTLLAPDMQQGIVRSTDGGRTWAAMAGGPMMAMWLAQDPSNQAHVLVVGQQGVSESRDAGATWSPVQSPPNTSAVAMTGGSSPAWYAGALVDQKPVIYRSTDGGANWTSVSE